MKKTLTTILCLIMLVSSIFVFASCDKKDDVSKIVIDESYFTIDYETNYGVYWFGPNQTNTNNDRKRLSESDVNYFDPEKPTIIYFHGWEPGNGVESDQYFNSHSATLSTIGDATIPLNEGSIQLSEVNYAQQFRAQGYNVAVCDFSSYAKSLASIFGSYFVNFKVSKNDILPYALNFVFAREIAAVLGNSYSKELTYVGHSCGGFGAVAVNYMMARMYESGYVTSKNLIATRMTLADPYFGGASGYKDCVSKTMLLLDEKINSRSCAEIVSDEIGWLKTRYSTVTDIYCGMPMAYEFYLDDNSQTTKEEVLSELYSNTTWTVCEGLQKKYGEVGNIHNITRDWVLSSKIVSDLNKLQVKDDEGNVLGIAPSFGVDNEEIGRLIGNQYKQTYTGFDYTKDYLLKV